MNLTTNSIFKRVLLIEDDDSHALLIKRALADLVAYVQISNSLHAAVSLLEQDQYDLVISDLNLPDASRDDAVLALRKDCVDVPLLVLTSSSLVGDGVAAMRAGADDFLVKNFDSTFKDVLQVVLQRLRNVVDARVERQRLERDRAVLREAIENSNDGLAVVSRDGRIGHRNAAFDSFLLAIDSHRETLIMQGGSEHNSNKTVLEKLQKRLLSLPPGGVWTTEFSVKTAIEQYYELSISMSDQTSGVDTAVVWVRDVSEKKERDRFQRELLSTTTHDLKGPLGTISLSCEVLQKKGNDEPLVDGIASSARSALQLIDEFLSARSIEDGAYVLRPAMEPFAPTIHRVLDSLRIAAEQQKITFDFSGEGKEISGCFDSLAFERVLTNLVSNAIKFSPKEGRVVVSCWRTNSGAVCAVKDQGSGIDASDIHRLFERYGRLEKHAHITGTGLGLFIVRCIMNAHGGSIEVTSEQGKGTTFEVFFPDEPPRDARGEILCVDGL